MKKSNWLWLLIIPLFLSACGEISTTTTTTTTTTTITTTSTTTSTTLAGAILKKGPYLVYPNENTSMIVIWQSPATPAVSQIEWGTTTAYGNAATTTESGSGDYQHLFLYKISSLSPATKYYYKVTVDDLVSTGSFVTAPESGADSVTFYASSDHHGAAYEDTIMEELLADLSGDPARQTFYLNAGDLNNDSEDEDVWDDEFFNTSYTHTWEFLRQVPMIPSLGNHDIYHTDFSTAEKPGELVRKYWPFSYYAATDRSYYSVDYGSAHFIVLDQYNDGSAYTIEGSAQYNWLVSDLTANTKPWLFVMFHEPAWTASRLTGYHGNNTDIQNVLCPLFDTYGVDLVLQGHQHFYSRVKPAGRINYLTLGSGGGSLGTPDPLASYLVASHEGYSFARFDIVDDTTMTVTAVDEGGLTVDSFTVTN